eukprot:scaffold2727_cov385-Prasinococcus_capsulatus_cf.AAC.15
MPPYIAEDLTTTRGHDVNRRTTTSVTDLVRGGIVALARHDVYALGTRQGHTHVGIFLILSDVVQVGREVVGLGFFTVSKHGHNCWRYAGALVQSGKELLASLRLPQQ